VVLIPQPFASGSLFFVFFFVLKGNVQGVLVGTGTPKARTSSLMWFHPFWKMSSINPPTVLGNTA
jgi:hypothetical protein